MKIFFSKIVPQRGFFWQIIRIFDFFSLASDSRYLQSWALKSPSHEKSIFLKIRFFFSFNFFQGHNWLTNYPDSEFHGSWKTVTLSSISSNLSKHWRFLAFWLSLCFGSCLLFLVCHDKAFLFSTRAMTALGWLPNAHRDIIILVQWDRPSRDT